jgi:hypothetical protein
MAAMYASAVSSLVTDAMRAALGTELSRTVSHPVSASDIRRWATAVYWPEPPPARYLSAEPPAPEDLNPFAWAVAEKSGAASATRLTGNDPDHTEKILGIAGPGLANQLNGGLTITYGTPMHVGDTITSVRTLDGYRERDGRLGRMLFTTTADTWTNQRGELVKRTALTLIRY